MRVPFAWGVCSTKTMSEQDERTIDSCRGFLRRKWRLLLLVVLGLVAAELLAARLWDEFYPLEAGRPGSLPPITEAQKQSAVDFVSASGIVERINGGQAWKVTEVRDNVRGQSVNVYVEWKDPVESDGPWLTSGAPEWLLRGCRNVRSRFHVPISNIHFLRLSVQLEGMEIIRLWPHSLPPRTPDKEDVVGQGNWLGHYEIYNEKSKRFVYRGPMIFSAFVPGTCPRGDRH